MGWPLLVCKGALVAGRYLLSGGGRALGFAAKRPVTTVAASAVADQVVTGGEGRKAAFNKAGEATDSFVQARIEDTLDSAGLGEDTINFFQENWGTLALAGGALSLLMMGGNGLKGLVTTALVGVIGYLGFKHFLKSDFNNAATTPESPAADHTYEHDGPEPT